MARTTKELTDLEVKTAKAGDKPKHLFDGKGLFLLIAPLKLRPDGKPQPVSKWWRFKYTFAGKTKTISFGTYPEVSLSDARQRREDARKLLANGTDPGEAKKAQKAAQGEQAANTFEVIARQWHAEYTKDKNITEEHTINIMNRLEKDIFPWIGKKPITEITAPEIQSILDRVKSRGVIETARRAKTIIGQVYTYAIRKGWAMYDISAGFKRYLPSVNDTRKHMAAITDPKELAPFLRALDGYQGAFVTKCALRIAPLVFVRPGELRKAEWSEFDFERKEWVIPAAKMKMRVSHVVPLSDQVISILEELKPLTGNGKYLFPSLRSAERPMSDNTVNAAFKRMGFDGDTVVGHGLRATARTLIHEILGFTPDAIEAQLAHVVPDRHGRAYNRTAHLAERRRMLQQWADYLDGLKTGAKVIPLKREG